MRNGAGGDASHATHALVARRVLEGVVDAAAAGRLGALRSGVDAVTHVMQAVELAARGMAGADKAECVAQALQLLLEHSDRVPLPPAVFEALATLLAHRELLAGVLKGVVDAANGRLPALAGAAGAGCLGGCLGAR